MIFEDRNRQKAYEGIRRVMKHWGFGDSCASIYAVLVVSDKPMTADEISKSVGYAYSSVINELNRLMREGFIERGRKGRRYTYSAVTDFLEIIRKERHRLMGMLKETKNSLEGIKNRKMEGLAESINASLEYLREVERRYKSETERVQ